MNGCSPELCIAATRGAGKLPVLSWACTESAGQLSTCFSGGYHGQHPLVTGERAVAAGSRLHRWSIYMPQATPASTWPPGGCSTHMHAIARTRSGCVCVCAHHSRGFPRAAGLPTRYPNAHVCNQQTMVSQFRIEIQLGKNYCACGSTSRAGNLANKIINRLDN